MILYGLTLILDARRPAHERGSTMPCEKIRLPTTRSRRENSHEHRNTTTRTYTTTRTKTRTSTRTTTAIITKTPTTTAATIMVAQKKNPTLTTDPTNEHENPCVRVQTRGTCAHIVKFLEHKSRTSLAGATTAPDGWWSHSRKQVKVNVFIICGIRATVLFLKLMSVQSAKTRVYVIGRIVSAS